MFGNGMQKNELPLIIVCDDKDMVYANYLIQLIGQKDAETTRQADLYYNMTISNFKDIQSKLQKLQRNISTMDSYMTQLETYSYGNIKPVNSN